MGVHIDNVTAHLEALLQQESSPRYRIGDYLSTDSRKIQKRKDTPSRGDSTIEVPDLHSSMQDSGGKGFMHKVSTSWTLTSQGRWQIGQWFYRMIADFKFPRELAMISMNYLDRVLSSFVDDPPKSKEEVQLIALSCFYLAVKLFQAGPVLSTDQMSILSGGMYSAQQVSAMEQRILFALSWSLHPPCGADFVRPFFMIILRNTGFPPDLSHFDVLELALGMLHTGVLDYFFIAQQSSPSHMAAAALLNAMHAVLPESYPLPSVQELILQIEKDTNCTLNEGQIDVCRQRFWTLLDRTGMGCPNSSDFATEHQQCPTTPPSAKRIKSDISPSSPNGVLEVEAVQSMEELQAPFQFQS